MGDTIIKAAAPLVIGSNFKRTKYVNPFPVPPTGVVLEVPCARNLFSRKIYAAMIWTPGGADDWNFAGSIKFFLQAEERGEIEFAYNTTGEDYAYLFPWKHSAWRGGAQAAEPDSIQFFSFTGLGFVDLFPIHLTVECDKIQLCLDTVKTIGSGVTWQAVLGHISQAVNL